MLKASGSLLMTPQPPQIRTTSSALRPNSRPGQAIVKMQKTVHSGQRNTNASSAQMKDKDHSLAPKGDCGPSTTIPGAPQVPSMGGESPKPTTSRGADQSQQLPKPAADVDARLAFDSSSSSLLPPNTESPSSASDPLIPDIPLRIRCKQLLDLARHLPLGVETLEEGLEDTRRGIQIARQEAENAKQELGNATDEAKKLTWELAETNAYREREQAELKACRAKVSELERSIEDLNGAIREKDADISQKDADMEKWNNEKDDLLHQVKTCEAKDEIIKEKDGIIKEKDAVIEELNHEKSSWDTKALRLEDERDKLKDEVADLTEETISLKSKSGREMRKIKKLSEENEGLNKRVNEMSVKFRQASQLFAPGIIADTAPVTPSQSRLNTATDSPKTMSSTTSGEASSTKKRSLPADTPAENVARSPTNSPSLAGQLGPFNNIPVWSASPRRKQLKLNLNPSKSVA